MVCLRNISVDTLHKGDTKDNNNDDNNNNNNNNIDLWSIFIKSTTFQNAEISIKRQEGKAVPLHTNQTYVLFVIKLGTRL